MCDNPPRFDGELLFRYHFKSAARCKSPRVSEGDARWAADLQQLPDIALTNVSAFAPRAGIGQDAKA